MPLYTRAGLYRYMGRYMRKTLYKTSVRRHYMVRLAKYSEAARRRCRHNDV